MGRQIYLGDPKHYHIFGLIDSVGSDLGPNCLQRLSPVDDKIAASMKTI